MSHENVELVQRAYDLFDTRELPAFFDLFDPSLTYANRADEPDAREYHGVEDFKGYVASRLDGFENLRFEFHELVDLGDRVVVVTDVLGRGRATGADVRGAYVFVWTIHDGKVVELREYATKEEAIEAAGVSTQQDAQADF